MVMDKDTPLYKPTRRGSAGMKSHLHQPGDEEETVNMSPASQSTRESGAKRRDSNISTTSQALLQYLDTKYGVSADEHELQPQEDSPQERRWSSTHYDQPLQYDSESDDEDESCSSRCSYSTISTHQTPHYVREALELATEKDVGPFSPKGRSRSRTRPQTPRYQSFAGHHQYRSSSSSKTPRRCHSVGVPNRHHAALPTIEEFQPQKVELSIRSLPSARTLHNVVAQRRRQHQLVANNNNNNTRHSVVRRKLRSSEGHSLLVWDQDALEQNNKTQMVRRMDSTGSGNSSPKKMPRSKKSNEETGLLSLPPPPPRSKSRSPRNKNKGGSSSPKSILKSNENCAAVPPPPPPPPRGKSRSPRNHKNSSPKSLGSNSNSSTHTASMMSPPKMPRRMASPHQLQRKSLATT